MAPKSMSRQAGYTTMARNIELWYILTIASVGCSRCQFYLQTHSKRLERSQFQTSVEDNWLGRSVYIYIYSTFMRLRLLHATCLRDHYAITKQFYVSIQTNTSQVFFTVHAKLVKSNWRITPVALFTCIPRTAGDITADAVELTLRLPSILRALRENTISFASPWSRAKAAKYRTPSNGE